LLATRLVSRIRRALGVELSLRELFEAPTVAELARRLEQNTDLQSTLTPQERPELLPLSFAQQRLWFLHQLEGPSATYNMPLALRMTGRVRHASLEAALNDVLRRHESLRTILPDHDGRPHQQVLDPAAARIVLSVEQVTESQLPDRLESGARKPFHLDRDIPIRAQLLMLGQTDSVLLIVLHHVAADGWSMAPLARDLMTAYEARQRDEKPEWAPLPVQYADYALWQHEVLGAEDDPHSRISRQLDYWVEQLKDLPDAAGVPADRPRPEVATYGGDVVRFTLDGSLHHDLASLARANDSSFFMVLQASVAALLHRLGAGADIPIGSGVAGRTDEATEDLVGLFVNMLVIRTDLSGNPAFTTLLARVRDTSLAAYDNQHIPFETLVERLNPHRSAAHHPLFQVALVLQNTEQPHFDLPGLRMDALATTTGTARYDLLLSLTESRAEDGTPSGVSGWIEFATDLYDRATVEKLVERWLRLLQAVVQDPAVRVGSVDLLDDAERELLGRRGRAEQQHAQTTLPALFTARVAGTPDALAISDGPLQWTYCELDSRAEAVARRLLDRGVGFGDLIGVALRRGAEQIAAMLGILKIGAVYVPVDPDYPSERIALLMRDAAPVLLLVSSQTADFLPPDLPTELAVVVPADPDEQASTPVGPLRHPGPDPRDPAYVIYTSGSTGLPKGVVVGHAGIANLAETLRDRCAVDEHSRVLALSSPSFDASIFEIVAAFAAGAALVVPRQRKLVGEDLARALAEERISVALIPPSLLDTLPDDAPTRLPGLRTLVVGAEPCPPELMVRWSPGRRMVNAYGPTETTVVATISGPIEPPRVPIGRPVLGTDVAVLDERLELAVPSVAGELYVSGPSVAHGYLGRPGLTAERFVADPSGPPGSRTYRTGDLVRWSPERDLEHLGRTDEQVKVRGFRVEPGEVRGILDRHPAVARAVVVSERQEATTRLVAYVVLTPDAVADAPDEQVDEWRQVYDSVYVRSDPPALGTDFAGWNSSYTGGAIPFDEMREWRDAAVESVLRHRPHRVLEIGVGSGLLLAKIAPHVEAYWGTDLSGAVVDRVHRQVAEEGLPNVHVRQQAAHDVAGLPSGYFDTIVLNSVVQYFPSQQYLVGVLRTALELLTPGGRVIVGDVRHLGTLRPLHTAIEAPQAADAARLRSAVERSVVTEKELLLDPAFFTVLADTVPEVAGVDVRLKRGGAHNELTRYRYEVAIHKAGADVTSIAGLPAVAWDERISDLTDLDLLDLPVRLTGIVNPRLHTEVAAARALASGAPLHRVRGALLKASIAGLDPERVHRWAGERDRSVVITWSSSMDTYDAVIMSSGGAYDVPLTDVHRAHPELPSPSALASHPAGTRVSGQVVTKIRRDLGRSLPEHLLPSAVVAISEIPLTPNGKLDRHALPELAHSVTGRAPRTPEEEILCGLFAELLGLPTVGVEDSFFDLGGHSLLATRLVSRVRSVLGVELPLQAVFTSPTVGTLVTHLERAAVATMRLEASARPSVLPLSFAQRRLWFLHRLEGPSATYNMPIALRLVGELDVAALTVAVNDVIGRHEALRTVFPDEDGLPRQHVLESWEAAVDLSVVETAPDLLADELDRAARHEFRLNREIPVRTTLFRTGPAEWVLLVVLHHIASDGWSMGPLARDLQTAYSARRDGESPGWAPLPVQYADYAIWQYEALGDATDAASVLGRQMEYWSGQLSGLPEQVSMPTDRPRPPRPSYTGAVCPVAVHSGLHRAITALARAHDVTVFMLLQASLASLLSRLGAGNDIPIGTPVAGRTDEALDDLVGFFVNTLVIRTDTSGDPTFTELLARVRETSLAAYAHQDVPFEHLVEKLNPVRSASHHPMFQIILALHNTDPVEFRLPGLKIGDQTVSPGVSRVDLTINLREVRGPAGEPGGLHGSVEYATDLFDAATVETFVARWVALMEDLVRHPDRPVSDAEVTTADELRRMSRDWSPTDPRVVPVTLPDLLDATTAEHAGAVAVTDDRESLTYAELDRHTNPKLRRL
jgi:pristinamycin I synthase-3/4